MSWIYRVRCPQSVSYMGWYCREQEDVGVGMRCSPPPQSSSALRRYISGLPWVLVFIYKMGQASPWKSGSQNASEAGVVSVNMSVCATV